MRLQILEGPYPQSFCGFAEYKDTQKMYSEAKAQAPSAAAFVEQIETFAELERLQLDAVESRAFNAQNISPDFAFLKLPTTLTAEEVQRL